LHNDTILTVEVSNTKEGQKMNNKKPRRGLEWVMAVALSLMLFAGNLSVVFADDSLEDAEGNLQTMQASIEPSGGAITPNGDLGYYTTKTLVQTTYKKFVFARYLTNYWVKTDRYGVAEGDEIELNFGFSYEGVTLTVTGSKIFETSYTVVADPARWSRLAAFADFTIKKYLVKRYTTGGMLVDSYFSYSTTTTAIYVAAKYQ
jgi:hypothetical protein